MSGSVTVVGFVYFELALPLEDVAMGRERFVDRIDAGIGGAFNTAWIAHALGLPVILAHPAGNGHTDRAIATSISSFGLPSLTWEGRDESAISLVLTGGGDRAFVSSADFAALESCPDLIGSSWIHVPGLREARILHGRLSAARSRGARISVAGSWAEEELDVLVRSRPPWDLLFLNELEAKRAGGALGAVLDRLSEVVPNVVITLGARGAIGLVGGERFAVPASPIEVANATGAGDAFAAGFLAGHLRGDGARRAAELACEVSARYLARRRSEPSIFADLRIDG